MENTEKEYTGACYIGVVGSESENGYCRDSIEMVRRNADDTIAFIRATKGYEARQLHLNNWYEKTDKPFILFLDSDMVFPPDTLERLRAWKMPYVSGAYMRRRYAPLAPVWFDYAKPGQMPMQPFTGIFIKDQLYKIGANGWGCVLLHRDVVTAVRAILKGEPEIIEDDMDLYPYDLRRIMGAVQALEDGIGTMTMKQAQEQIAILKEEIRPLRGLKDAVGSDIRFPFYARLAGFDMYLDTGVQCEHMVSYPVSPNDFIGQPASTLRDLTLSILKQNHEERERIEKALADL